MKTGIHPEYVAAQVTCACGNAFTTRSTQPVIKLEICSACHPFFTGKQKLMDITGRVDRFKRRFAKTEGKMVASAPKAKEASKTARISQAVKPKVLTTAPRKAKTPKTEKKS